VKVFDADKTRMIGLLYCEKNYDNNCVSRFHLIPEHHGRTDRNAISISRVSVLTCDKNAKSINVVCALLPTARLNLANICQYECSTFTENIMKSQDREISQ